MQQSLPSSDRMLAQAAHDLQEPLRLLSGYIDLLCAHLDGKASLDAPLLAHEAKATAERMQALVASVLDYARLANGIAAPPTSIVSLAAAMEDAKKNLRLRIDETGARVTADDLPMVRGDPAQISRVFQNLLENCLKYGASARALEVHVSSRQEADRWVVDVDDNGPGWPPGRERLFRPFVRLHKNDVAGSGLGLATVRGIVESMGGSVEASDAPGGGARVELRFARAP